VLADAAEAAAAAEVGGEGDAIDVYGRGAWLESFESEVASEFGKESALFFPTGVCAQLAALCVYAGGVGRGAGDLMPRLSRPSFIVQATSHLLLHEEDAARQLLGFTPLVVGAKDRPLSPADVEKVRASRRSERGRAASCSRCRTASSAARRSAWTSCARCGGSRSSTRCRCTPSYSGV